MIVMINSHALGLAGNCPGYDKTHLAQRATGDWSKAWEQQRLKRFFRPLTDHRSIKPVWPSSIFRYGPPVWLSMFTGAGSAAGLKYARNLL